MTFVLVGSLVGVGLGVIVAARPEWERLMAIRDLRSPPEPEAGQGT